MIFIIFILLAFVIYKFIKPYFQQYDTILLYTGGLGSGKSLVSSQMALRLLRKNRSKVFWHNFFHPRDKWAKPQLYSNIAFRISRKEWAYELTPGHMLMETAIVPGSVLYVDEICIFLDQFAVKLPAFDAIEEWATLFRHYSSGGYLGGYMVMNTQNSNKVNFHFRYCVNSALNLSYFKKWLPFKWLWLFCTVKVRNISLADDIKKIEEGNREESLSTLFIWRPFFKHYDTYTYSIRYKNVPKGSEHRFWQFKTGKLMKCPKGEVNPKTEDVYIRKDVSKSNLLKQPKGSRKGGGKA